MLEKQNTEDVSLTLGNTYYELRKYNILRKINELPHSKAQKLKKTLPQIFGLQRQTISGYINARVGDKKDIPSSILVALAEFFGCDAKDLINHPITKIEVE